MIIYIDFDDTIYKTNRRLEMYSNKPVVEWDVRKYGLTLDIFKRDDFYLHNDTMVIKDAKETIKALDKRYNVCILTKYVNNEEIYNKIKFMDFLELRNIPMRFLQINDTKTKQDFMIAGDILIDDDCRNLVPNDYNILFDYRNEFKLPWNCTNGYIKMTTWKDIYEYIVNISKK